jgi:hypothetical protein
MNDNDIRKIIDELNYIVQDIREINPTNINQLKKNFDKAIRLYYKIWGQAIVTPYSKEAIDFNDKILDHMKKLNYKTDKTLFLTCTNVVKIKYQEHYDMLQTITYDK